MDERTKITIRRTGMIGILVFGPWLYMRNENSPSLEYISMFLVAAAIISVMFWIKGEVEWAEFKKKNHRPNETYKSSKSSFADTLGLIASIITIIGAIIYVVKVIS